MSTSPELFVGLDLGTSGVRAVAIDARAQMYVQASVALPAPTRQGVAVQQDPELWWTGVEEVFKKLLQKIPGQRVQAIAVDGTSGTLLLADARGHPLAPALMYNDARCVAEAKRIACIAPPSSAAHGVASGLAKLLWLQHQAFAHEVRHALHQADWIVGRLCGRYDITDENNALKTGYDVQAKQWPSWLGRLGVRTEWLPQVVAPGTVIGPITPQTAMTLGLPPSTRIVAGTTDSTAAFLATGACAPGEAVTSLGSTLVVKVISQHALTAPHYGVYSQALGDLWLVGGGSNSGGMVLRQYFNDESMAALAPRLRFDQPTHLDYYPLLAPGERFPINDPHLAPRLTPRPADDAIFFQGLLEGIARIERQSYRLLAQLGAPYPRSVRSVGGGAQNVAWTQMRGGLLGVPMLTPEHHEAAYGTALLAAQSAPS